MSFLTLLATYPLAAESHISLFKFITFLLPSAVMLFNTRAFILMFCFLFFFCSSCNWEIRFLVFPQIQLSVSFYMILSIPSYCNEKIFPQWQERPKNIQWKCSLLPAHHHTCRWVIYLPVSRGMLDLVSAPGQRSSAQPETRPHSDNLKQCRLIQQSIRSLHILPLRELSQTLLGYYAQVQYHCTPPLHITTPVSTHYNAQGFYEQI